MTSFDGGKPKNGLWPLKKVLMGVLLTVAMVYVAFMAMAFFSSEGMIFLPHASSYRDTPEIIKITSANGAKISAMYLQNPQARFTLLVSHGNAEDLGDDRYWLEDLRRAGFSVLAFDYQGYGTSEGKPSEKGAYGDEAAAYDYLVQQLATPPERIIIYGRSVGSGPAVHLAARRPAAGLILQSPFLTAFRVLTQIPLLPFDRFPNARDIRNVHCPLLVIHGEADEVIPFRHGQKLFAIANQPKQFVGFPGAGHNDLELVAGAKCFEAIRSFTASLENPAR
jgi:fermentation-respiration switch protein FrsA (DUF1100 family)